LRRRRLVCASLQPSKALIFESQIPKANRESERQQDQEEFQRASALVLVIIFQ
jgi:hypothetical protein